MEVTAPGDGGRHIAGSTTGAVVRYVRSVGGEAGVSRLLDLAGESRPATEVEDPASWNSFDQTLALYTAAVEVTGDPEVTRRVGEDMLSQYAGTEVAALLRSLGSPGELLRNVAATAAKYSTITAMEAVLVEDDRALLTSYTAPPHVRHPLFCLYTAGLLSQASPLFGLEPAEVVELECQARGDVACLYEVRWDHHEGPGGAERRADHLAAQLASLTARFEALQATAGELVDTTTVEEALAAITRRAGLAVRAPQFLLAVRIRPDDDLRVHHTGFDDAVAAEALATRLVEGRLEATPSHLVVDVSSPRRRFGVLAAVYPTGQQFFAQERQMLAAYGGFAAAALEATASLEEARRQNTTARALLDLSRALARVRGTDEIVAVLAEAVHRVVPCRSTAVFLWDPVVEGLRKGGSFGLPPDVDAVLSDLVVTAADTPALPRMMADAEPMFFAATTPDPFLSAMVELARLNSAVAVPITSHDEFLGVVVIGRLESGRPDDDLVERLRGMADHAATALLNGRLLETVRRQALHDNLTGLPNARLLADRAAGAIAHARRNGTLAGMLFVDLDDFKPVNDTYGHAVGDTVLQLTAARLQSTLREGDTVARLGGDEFVVLLPDLASLDDACAAAERVVRALDAPHAVGRNRIRVSSSIGISLFPDHGDDFDALLHHADAAMYAAKSTDPGSYHHAGTGA